MSVYKPAKSRFYHYEFQFQRRRYYGSTGCAGKRDAQRFEEKVRRQAALGETAKPIITIDKACDAWFMAKGQHQSNHATHLYQLENLALILGQDTPLGDLDLAALDRYVARRRGAISKKTGKPLSNASVNREIQLLKRVCNWCEQRGYQTPVISWAEIKLKENAIKTRVLTIEEEGRLMAALPDALRPLVRFALISGQRKAEIVKLRWADVDFENARATVNTKGDQRHTFPLTPELTAIIANQPKVCAQVFTYVCERNSPPRGDRPRRIKGERYPFSKQGWDRKWRKARDAAGLSGGDSHFRFHDTRHTALTRTGSIEVANSLADHSDIRTTQRYFKTGEDEVRKAMMEAERKGAATDVSGRTAPYKGAIRRA